MYSAKKGERAQWSIYIVVTKHVMNHLENNKILYELQHGFRHNRSCETQLLSFIQEFLYQKQTTKISRQI